MSKKENKCVPSDSEDDDYSSPEDSSSEEEETVEVNGFQVLVSQENQVREMFEKHPDLTSNFDIKNQELKDAYMDVLLDLIGTLWMSTKDLSLEDLNKANSMLFDLTRAGLNVGWLCQKLDAAYLNREKQRVSKARIRELEEQVKKRKLALPDLKSDLKKAKAAAPAS
ncbi:MATH domain and coiled-coil domain-containing protein [Cardamine amara subsp. amara]|uniref:MATH domain and coiled-coil domain-containing protein n=1 Tax=Cardamine amara subsp. amara TaxID=228776 RepID=A0ABD1A454_CARAN